MMRRIVISEGQTLQDVVLQYFGSLEALYPFSEEQKISTTAMPSPGVYTTYLKPIKAVSKVIDTLNKKGWIPASNIIEPEGIGVGRIGLDFEIG